MAKLRVLFLAASPQVSPLRLDEEIREITTKIRAAEYRDSLEVISRWSVRPDDLQQALLEHQKFALRQQLWERKGVVRGVRLVFFKQRVANEPNGGEAAECMGIARHAWQRL